MEYTITKNAEFGSLEVRFDEKPADTVRLALKRLKMRWHGVNRCWYGYASESAIVAAILENAPEEQPATVCTDGYMGGGALYGSKSNKSLYGADRPLGGYSSRHQGGRDQGRNRQVQELFRRAVHHGHDPHKPGGLRR